MSTASNGSHDRSARQAKIQAAAPKESKLKPILAVIVALVAIAGIGAAIYFGTKSNDTGATNGKLPRGAVSETGGIMLNATDPGAGVPVLDIYEDFQCPACGFYHEQLGSTVDQLASSGKAKVVIHLKSFLDAGIPGEKSLKAANAAACASNSSPEAFVKMHDGIFATQPEQEGDGWPDMTFSDLAQKAGITGEAKKAYDQCVADVTYESYLKKVDEQSTKDGVKGTPTYRINGKDFDLRTLVDQQAQKVDSQGLVKAIEDATQK
ncbi:DsbA family protein [Mobilicoccus massiliensis]|uniref:DsbA family protein n=1 Tax=Mobilicoccus massiliensis TaxID=1522310 RepID=UPI000694ED7D|nr:thioredoxin domain-containing protein [Mobilicoccus massiliensis]